MNTERQLTDILENGKDEDIEFLIGKIGRIHRELMGKNIPKRNLS
jgi:hypothetical protein